MFFVAYNDLKEGLQRVLSIKIENRPKRRPRNLLLIVEQNNILYFTRWDKKGGLPKKSVLAIPKDRIEYLKLQPFNPAASAGVQAPLAAGAGGGRANVVQRLEAWLCNLLQIP
ncbi:MAG: hypothetical protein NZL91_08375 [Thermoflexales bacterium]|nr:hypothetical protein [Thermoflexales bacterium]MCX7937916.1 hypothetical protein [Thermoflexales bacterium]MDW8054846.1 hypothetical protein [Anaerolineae bacterium]MDW8293051.1 hypothetical protein [Anaerolineae bacterium]